VAKEGLPPGVAALGEQDGDLYYRPSGKDWIGEDKAREMNLTHSTLPTKNKEE